MRFTPVAQSLPNDHARVLVEDADGAVWIAVSGTGVARWRAGGLDLVTPAHGLAGTDVRALPRQVLILLSVLSKFTQYNE